MRTILFLLQKEFHQVFRNKAILAMIMVMPVIQLLILPLAADFEVKNINLAVVDNDHSPASRKLLNDVTSSGYFKLTGFEPSYNDAWKLIEADKADIILEIPAGFERTLLREGQQSLFIAVNAINGSKATLGGTYLQSIIRSYNQDLNIRWQRSANGGIAVQPLNWYNPLLNYKVFMVPGILALLVTMIGGFLSVLNIVKEKEAGTIEQINVTPIKKHHFIIGKLVPFWIMGMVVFSIGLCIARFVYGIIPLGSLLVLFGFVAIYLLAVLGFGLLISTFCDTQQQAMFIMFFFIMIFILLGGLFTSIDSMPGWVKLITKFNPVSYLISVLRMVVLKGSGWKDITGQLLAVSAMAVVFNVWAVINYRKTN